MAVTLEEFLVNVKYTVDEPSQQKFFAGLKRVATSVSGVTAELVGLSVGLVEVTKKLAEHGDALYWASQRLNTSIASIQGASYAMANLGVSTGEAQGAMEKFGAWQRSFGPSATGFLRTLGVSAKDTDIQLEQLGHRLSEMAAKGPAGYAMALQYAQAAGGLDERQARAIMDPRFAQYNQANERLQAQIWGTGTQGSRGDVRSRLKAQTDAYGESSNQMVQKFNQMGLFFETLTQKFALGLFKAIGPDIDRLNATLLQFQPHLEALFGFIIRYAPNAISFLSGFIGALGTFIDLTIKAIDWIGKLPPAMLHGAEAIGALKLGFELMSSPLGRFLALFTLFMLALDDYEQWQKNQNLPKDQQIRTAFDWSGFDKLHKTISPMVDSIDEFIKNLTGIPNALELAFGAAAASTLLGFNKHIWTVIRSTRVLGALFTAGGAIMAGLAAIAAVAVGNTMGQNTIKDKAKEMGWEYDKGGWFTDPSFKKDGKSVSWKEMLRMQGYDPETGQTMGQSFGVKPQPWEQGGKPAGEDMPTVVVKPDKESKNFWERMSDSLDKLVIGMQGDNESSNQFAGPGAPSVGYRGERVAPAGGGWAGAALTGRGGGGPAGGTGGGETNEIPGFAGPALPPEIQAPGDYSWGDLGTRANNPGNMNFAPGQGAVGRVAYNDRQTGGRHVMGAFRTMQEGVAAAYRLLLRNQQKYGKTIAGAFHGWAENPYFKEVARSMGLDPNSPFDIATADPAKIERMMEEQFKREGRRGSHSVTREQIMGGIELGRENLRPRGVAGAGAGDKNVTVNNSTTLTVQTPDPHAAGHKVHAELTRVHEFQTRHAQSRLV